jgi:tetratricopeptide (TPR) repeat protein
VEAPPYDHTGSHYGHHHDPTAHTAGATAVGMAHSIDELDDAPQAAPPPPIGGRSETNLEDDLDEADFYVGQGMVAEALDVLRALLERYPSHRMVGAKYREVEAMLHGDAAIEVPHDSIEESIEHEEINTAGTEAIDLDEIEELDDFEEIPVSLAEAPNPTKKRKPTVMLEKPVDESDAETHYDLGLAYKEMGLHDEAIKAFEKVLRAPGREVQCRVMIGMCMREQGNASEAIHQFKQGLHAEPQERERQSLYYEIGMTYESIGDEAEALYYFEMVTKRDPGFADAAHRADGLRARVGRGVRPAHDDDI